MYMYMYVQVSEGLILVSEPPLHNRGNFLDSTVELDRRLLDYIVGLDTEINELVDGSVRLSLLLILIFYLISYYSFQDLYTPDVTLQDVALPDEHRQLIKNTFLSFEQFQKVIL